MENFISNHFKQFHTNKNNLKFKKTKIIKKTKKTKNIVVTKKRYFHIYKKNNIKKMADEDDEIVYFCFI